MLSYPAPQSPSKLFHNSSNIPSQNHQAIINREPFYLSLNVQKLVFTQGSVLKSLIERWNQERKASFSRKNTPQNFDFEDMFRSENENKAVFILELYRVNNQNESQQTKISETIALGQVNNVSATTKLYQYPIDLTQMYLKPKSQLFSFLFHYSPQLSPELNLKIHMQLDESPEQQTLIGQCRLDPNLFIEMYLDEGISCTKDCKKIIKRIDSCKEIDQQIQIMLEMIVGRNRIQIELAKKQAKKGINVMDFKQHIRQILKEKQYLEIQEANPQEQISMENPHSNRQHQPDHISERPKKSTLNKYMTYLNRHVESQLKYFNPQQEHLEKQVKKLFSQRKSGAEKIKAEAQKRKKVKKQQDYPKETNKNHQQKVTKNPQNSLTLSGKDTQNNYKQTLKVVIFVVVSAILLYFSMTPTNRVSDSTET